MEDKYYYDSFDCEIQCEEDEDDDDEEDFWEDFFKKLEDPNVIYFV